MARIHRITVQKDPHDPDYHDGVITHLEPDMLEYEVKWALESITTNKASGGDGVCFLTRYDGVLREPLVWCQESQVSMRVMRRSP